MKLLLIILFLFLLPGCGGDDSVPASSGDGQNRKEEIEKWNLYVDLGNYLNSDFNPAMDEYFTRYGPGTDSPPGISDEYMADFLSRLVDDNQLSRELELALAKASAAEGDLDQATYEMGVQLKEVWAELIRARDYYAGGEYESDNYAQAKEVHDRIYDAYMSLSASNTRFLDILTKEDAERRKRDIQEMRDQGLVLRPAMLEVIDRGLALQELLNQLSITYGSLASFNPELFLPLYQDFEQSAAAFEAVAAGLSDKGNPEGVKGAALADFTRRLSETKASAADLIELKRLKGKLDAPAEDSSGTPENFGRELGFLVDVYNSLAPAK